MMLRRFLPVLVGAASLLVRDSSAEPRKGTSACQVTKPNGSTPPGGKPSSNAFGNGSLWTMLWPEGTAIVAANGPGEILRDGSLAIKLPWWRAVYGKLVITGKRLDAASSPLRSVVPDGYGETGFQSSTVVFPSEGCWEITGQVGDAKLTFVTLVTKKP